MEPPSAFDRVLVWEPGCQPEVWLSDEDCRTADHVGMSRFRASMNAGRNAGRNQSRSDEARKTDDCMGARAELAVALHLGIPYEGTVNTFHRKPDVGGFEVRSTRLQDGKLLVRPNDHDERPFIMVTTHGRRMVLRGWAFGRAAKRHEWWRKWNDKPGVWAMPQTALRPVPTQIRRDPLAVLATGSLIANDLLDKVGPARWRKYAHEVAFQLGGRIDFRGPRASKILDQVVGFIR